MASKQSTVDFIVEQAVGAGVVTARKMFGEYAIYWGATLVALVCDDRLFVKPTPEGRAYAGAVGEDSPYPGAKPHLVIDGDRWDEPDWLGGLFRISAAHLPPPAPKRKLAKKT